MNYPTDFTEKKLTASQKLVRWEEEFARRESVNFTLRVDFANFLTLKGISKTSSTRYANKYIEGGLLLKESEVSARYTEEDLRAHLREYKEQADVSDTDLWGLFSSRLPKRK